MNWRLFVPLAVFAGLALMLGVGLTLNPREVPSPFIGKPAPAFTLAQLHDPGKTLGGAEFKGQVWLLNVWASWCAPCREEHPLWVALAQQPQQVPIVGLNYKDEPQAAQQWLRKLGDPYRASVSDRDGRVGIEFGVYGVPETFLIDKAGIVRVKHVGPLTREIWATKFEPLIKQLRG